MSRGAKITWGIMAMAVVAAVVLVVRRQGLLPDCDFGCGQYYYTDVPGWESIFSGTVADERPLWLYLLLFFAWGGVMYFLWKRLDRS